MSRFETALVEGTGSYTRRGFEPQPAAACCVQAGWFAHNSLSKGGERYGRTIRLQAQKKERTTPASKGSGHRYTAKKTFRIIIYTIMRRRREDGSAIRKRRKWEEGETRKESPLGERAGPSTHHAESHGVGAAVRR